MRILKADCLCTAVLDVLPLEAAVVPRGAAITSCSLLLTAARQVGQRGTALEVAVRAPQSSHLCHRTSIQRWKKLFVELLPGCKLH